MESVFSQTIADCSEGSEDIVKANQLHKDLKET